MVTVMNSVDTNHEDMIHDAQLDYYGIRLATCSTDKSVKIFDVGNGIYKNVVELKEHDGPVWQLAWAHPTFGTILASCSYDKKVIIWKETNSIWSKFYEYTGFDSSVNSVCWAPYEYGLILAAGSSDRSISIITYMGDGMWEAKKINNAHTISCNAVSWGPSLKLCSSNEVSQGASSLGLKRFVSGGADTLVKIWREVNNQWVEEKILQYHADWVRDVAWAPSIGLNGDIIASCSQDRKVIIWSNNGANDEWIPLILHEFSDVVWHLSWSVTGNILAVSGGDNKVSMWKKMFEDKWSCISNFDK